MGANMGEHAMSEAEQPQRCQRVVDSGSGRMQCPNSATWIGRLHAAREIYIVKSCEQHSSGLIDAEPIDGNWG